MPLYSTPAVVLRGRDLGERDRLFTFYTEALGKIKGVTRGGRRLRERFGSALQPLSLVHLILFGREQADLYRINSTDYLGGVNRLYDDFDRLQASLYVVGLVDATVREKEPNPGLFRLLMASMRGIGAGHHLESLRPIFALHLGTLLGYRPQLGHCVQCRAPLAPPCRFSPVLGGVLCASCGRPSGDAYPIQMGTVQLMERLLSLELEEAMAQGLPPELSDELSRVVSNHLAVQVGGRARPLVLD